MPKKFQTNKGIKEFPDGATQEQINQTLFSSGVTNFSPVESIAPPDKLAPGYTREKVNELKSLSDTASNNRKNSAGSGKTLQGTSEYGMEDEDLSPGNTAASILRPFASRAAAGAVASRIPHPLGKLLGAILSYTATDQAAQEGQRQVFGQRPKGIIEQATQPGNEVIGRLMGTAENAGLDLIPGAIANKIAKKFAKPVTPQATPEAPKTGVTNAEFSPLPKSNIRDAEYTMAPNGGLPGTSKAPKALGSGPDRIIELPGEVPVSPITPRPMGGPAVSESAIPNAIDALRSQPTRMSVSELNKKIDTSNGPLAEVERLISSPEALTKALSHPESAKSVKGYYASKALQGAFNPQTGQFDIGALKATMDSPNFTKIYNAGEASEVRRLFHSLGAGKGKTGDLKIGPEGVILSGAILSGVMNKSDDENQQGAMMIPMALFMRNVLRGAAGKMGAHLMNDLIERNNISIPLRKFGTMILRPLLLGSDAILQKHDGTNESVKVE